VFRPQLLHVPELHLELFILMNQRNAAVHRHGTRESANVTVRQREYVPVSGSYRGGERLLRVKLLLECCTAATSQMMLLMLLLMLLLLLLLQLLHVPELRLCPVGPVRQLRELSRLLQEGRRGARCQKTGDQKLIMAENQHRHTSWTFAARRSVNARLLAEELLANGRVPQGAPALPSASVCFSFCFFEGSCIWDCGLSRLDWRSLRHTLLLMLPPMLLPGLLLMLLLVCGCITLWV
jgi:hypothetical protein